MSTTTYIGHCIKIKKHDLVNLNKAWTKKDFFEIPNENYSFDDNYSYLIPNTNGVGKEIDYGFTDLSELANIEAISKSYFNIFIQKLEDLGVEYTFLFGVFMYAY